MTVGTTDLSTALSVDKEKLLNISAEDWDRVMKHYNVTSEDVKDMVSSVQDWLSKQPHLPGGKLHDQQIIGHLTFRGFSVEKFKISLDDYFTAPHRMPDIICKRDPLDPIINEYLKEGYWIVIPEKTTQDHRLTIFRLKPRENISIIVMVKIPFMFMEYRIWNDAALGDSWLLDLEHVRIQDVMQITPTIISNIVFYVIACFGAKLKSVYVFNMPPFAAAIVNIFKKLIKTKLGDRIFVVDQEEISNIFPKKCLPKEYGGEAGAFQDIADKWCKTIQSKAWRQFLIDQDSVVTDESKRLTPSPNTVAFDKDIFGADGSFRKMCLD